MSNGRGRIKIGLSMAGYGYNRSAWRHPSSTREALHDYRYFLKRVQIAEQGLLDMVFLADSVAVPMNDNPPGSVGREPYGVSFEPLTLLSALAPATSNIGLVATVSTSFQEPFHIARMFASLDHLSGGRAAWNVITSAQDAEAQNFSLGAMPPKAVRYCRAREAVETVTALWNSWDSDAIIFDKINGRYFDSSKVHQINYSGKHFKVAGPLNMPRTPQGHPVIVQSGASEEGQRLAAQTAEVVYAAVGTLADAQRFYHNIKSRLPSFGRSDSEVRIMPGLMPVIGKTQEEADGKYRELLNSVDPVIGEALLRSLFGDLSNIDLDGPVPDKLADNAVQSSRADLMLKVAKEKGQSLRALYQEELTNHHHNVVVGTPAKIADLMEEWFAEYGADGFNLIPAFTTNDLIDFVDLVMPELRRRDLVRSRYEGRTLRDNLELPYPR